MNKIKAYIEELKKERDFLRKKASDSNNENRGMAKINHLALSLLIPRLETGVDNTEKYKTSFSNYLVALDIELGNPDEFQDLITYQVFKVVQPDLLKILEEND